MIERKGTHRPPILSPEECKRDIGINCQIIELIAAARDLAVHRFPEIHDILSPDPAHKQPAQTALETLIQKRDTEKDEDKKNKLSEKIQMLEQRIKQYDDIVFRKKLTDQAASLKEEKIAVKNDPDLSEKEKEEKINELNKIGGMLTKKIKDYIKKNPFIPTPLSDDVFRKRLKKIRNLQKSCRFNERKYRVLSTLTETDTQGWGHFFVHIDDKRSKNLKEIVRQEAKKNNLNNAFIYIIAENKLKIAYVMNGKVQVIDQDPALNEWPSMDAILSKMPPHDIGSLIKMDAEKIELLTSKIADLDTQLSRIEDQFIIDRRISYNLNDIKDATAIDLMDTITNHVDVLSTESDKDKKELEETAHEKLYSRSISLFFRLQGTLSSFNFEEKKRYELTASGIDLNDYTEFEKYEGLGFKMTDDRTPSDMKKDARAALDNLTATLDELSTLNNQIAELEQTLTGIFFNEKKTLDLREKIVSDNKEEKTEKKDVDIRIEEKLANDLRHCIAMALALSKKYYGSAENPLERRIIDSGLNRMDGLSFADLYQKISAIEQSGLEPPKGGLFSFFSSEPSPLYAMAVLRKQLNHFHNTHPDFNAYLPKEQLLNEDTGKLIAHVTELATEVLAEVKNTLFDTTSPEPKKDPLINVEKTEKKLEEMYIKRKELHRMIDVRSIDLKKHINRDKTQLEECSRLFLKKKIIETIVSIVNAGKVVDDSTKHRVDFWEKQAKWYIPCPDAIRKFFNPAPAGILAIRKLLASKDLSMLKEDDCDAIIKKLLAIGTEKTTQYSALRTSTSKNFYTILSRITLPDKKNEQASALYDCTKKLMWFENQIQATLNIAPRQSI